MFTNNLIMTHFFLIIILIQHLKLSDAFTWNVGSPNVTYGGCGRAVGYDGSQNEIVLFNLFNAYVYSIDNNNFTEETDIPTTDKSAAQFYTQINNQLYMIDYIGTYPQHNWVLSYFELDTRIFRENPHNTNFPYSGVSTACLTHWWSHIIVIGGEWENKLLNNVAMYAIDENIWVENVPELQTGRRVPSCFAAKNNIIYVFGGVVYNYGINITRETTETIEKLDLYDFLVNHNSNASWSYNDYSLSTPKSGTRVVEYGNDLYIIGGYYSKNYLLWSEFEAWSLSEVDVLNVNTETVLPFFPLEYDTESTAAIFVDDILYAFGGCRHNSTKWGTQYVYPPRWQYFDFLQTSEPTTSTTPLLTTTEPVTTTSTTTTSENTTPELTTTEAITTTAMSTTTTTTTTTVPTTTFIEKNCDCNGGMVELTVQYIGECEAHITAYYDIKKHLDEMLENCVFDVFPGTLISCTAPVNYSRFQKKLYFDITCVNDRRRLKKKQSEENKKLKYCTAKIDTSCNTNIIGEQSKGCNDLKVISYVSGDGAICDETVNFAHAVFNDERTESNNQLKENINQNAPATIINIFVIIVLLVVFLIIASYCIYVILQKKMKFNNTQNKEIEFGNINAVVDMDTNADENHL